MAKTVITNYSSVNNIDQGMFKNPRQKVWGVANRSSNGWQVSYFSYTYYDALEYARSLLNKGGQYISIDGIILFETVPLDSRLVPAF